MVQELKIPKGINYKIMDDKRKELGLSMDELARKADVPEQSTKNILLGKTGNPGIDNLHSLCDALGLSIEEVLYNDEKKAIETKAIREDELSILALKEIYETHQKITRETTEEHINNIRAHYEQHHDDMKENYEKRLADKRELIDSKDAHIKALQKECLHIKVFAILCIAVLVGILIMEVMNPELGWIKF